MDPIEKARATRDEEIAAGQRRWYYLSFATKEEFLGGLQLEAFGPADAHLRASEMGMNPGGSVVIVAAPPGFVPPAGTTDRLMSLQEIERLDAELDPNSQPMTPEERDAALNLGRRVGQVWDVRPDHNKAGSDG